MSRKNRKQDPKQQTLLQCARQNTSVELRGNLDQMEIAERENFAKLNAQLAELHQKRQASLQRIRRIEHSKYKRDAVHQQQAETAMCKYTTELPEELMACDKLLFRIATCSLANICQPSQPTAPPAKALTDTFGIKQQLQGTELHREISEAASTRSIPSEFLSGYSHSFPAVLNQLHRLDIAETQLAGSCAL